MFFKMKKALKGEKGMLDLASVITGVIITGILGSVVAASFIFIIPWFQDKAAQDDINLIKIAEDAHYSDKSIYGNKAALDTGRYLHKTLSTKVCVVPNATGTDYTVYVESKSKNKFSYTPAQLKPTPISSSFVLPC